MNRAVRGNRERDLDRPKDYKAAAEREMAVVPGVDSETFTSEQQLRFDSEPAVPIYARPALLGTIMTAV